MYMHICIHTSSCDVYICVYIYMLYITRTRSVLFSSCTLCLVLCLVLCKSTSALPSALQCLVSRALPSALQCPVLCLVLQCLPSALPRALLAAGDALGCSVSQYR